MGRKSKPSFVDEHGEIPNITPDMTAREAAEIYPRILAAPRQPRVHRRKKRRGNENLEIGEIYDDTVMRPVSFAGKGGKQSKGRLDFVIDRCLLDAAKGDLGAAENLIDMHDHSVKHGDFIIEERVIRQGPRKRK